MTLTTKRLGKAKYEFVIGALQIVFEKDSTITKTEGWFYNSTIDGVTTKSPAYYWTKIAAIDAASVNLKDIINGQQDRVNEALAQAEAAEKAKREADKAAREAAKAAKSKPETSITPVLGEGEGAGSEKSEAEKSA